MIKLNRKPSKKLIAASTIVSGLVAIGVVINKLSTIYDKKHIRDDIYVSK